MKKSSLLKSQLIFTLRKMALLVILMAAAINANAQGLTGTKAIPGDYASIEAAIADLNTNGVGSGGVIFNVAAWYTETITAPLSITATGTGTSGTPANPITFQKSGEGANPLITAYTGGIGTPATAVQDGVWNLVGSDYVTIDGIDLLDPNSANPATMEYGYGMFKASVTDGCKYNTIKNCVVTLSRENWLAGVAPALDGSRAINVMNSYVTTQNINILGTLILDASGSNSYNKFYSNTLQNCNTGIALVGCVGAIVPTNTLYRSDYGNDIGGSSPATGNTVINYGGGLAATTEAVGIRTAYQYDFNVSYNTVNNNNGSGVNHPAKTRGIYLKAALGAYVTISHNDLSLSRGSLTTTVTVIENASGSNALGSTVDIINNTIHDCGGAAATSGFFYGIFNNNVNPVNMNINNNSFASITHTGSGGVYLIYQLTPYASNLSICNNMFTNLSFASTGSVYLISNGTLTNTMTISNNTISGTLAKTAAGGFVSGIYSEGGAAAGGTATLTGNNFSNISIVGATIFYGIRHTTTTTSEIHVITDNIVSNISGGSGLLFGIHQAGGADGSTINGNTVSGWTGSGAMIGINLGKTTASASLTVYNNNINNLSTTNSGSLNGINNVLGVSNSIFKNKIYNLEVNNSLGSVNGIYVENGINTNIYNNLISDLRTPIANIPNSIAGINLFGGTTNNVYYNTIYLNAASTGSTFGSSGIYATETPASIDMRNNIIVNASIPKGMGGYTAAYRRSSPVLTNYSATSNNNLFYAGTPGAYNVIMCDGTNTYTLETFQALVSPMDASSVTELPPFVNIATTPYDLHINGAVSTLCANGGIPVNTPIVITEDYDGNLRNLATPDIGADEFNSVTPCILPSGVTAGSINSGDANLSWTPGSTETAWEFVYGVSPLPVPTNPGTPSTSNTVNHLAGLSENTTYDVYVRSDCGGGNFSAYTVVYSFLTPSVVPLNTTVSGEVLPEATICYNAMEIISVAVSPNTFSVQNGGVATFIAGSAVIFYPGTSVREGGAMHAYISPGGPWCLTPFKASEFAAGVGEPRNGAGHTHFTLYPNPATGSFMIMQKDGRVFNNLNVAVYNMQGETVLTSQLTGENKHEVVTSSLFPGLYFVKVVAGDYVETIKLIRKR